MGLRFRKSIRLMPGLRINLSGSGASMTLGPRGASIGLGSRGAYLNAGIPGTGIYARERIGASPTVRRTRQPATYTNMKTKISIDDSGVLSFMDEQGNPLPDAIVAIAKKQLKEQIKGLIQKQCDDMNSRTEALGETHLHTPSPLVPSFTEEAFSIARPISPALKAPGFLCRFIKSLRDKVDAENADIINEHNSRIAEWERWKADFEAKQALRKELFTRVGAGDKEAMEQYIETLLKDILWPRETLVSFEINEKAIVFDVDLPEIEDMPSMTYVATQRGMEFSTKEMSTTQIQKLYMRHIHAVGFRIIGEAFAALPRIETVVLSGYSQRPNKTTGQVVDEYLYSAKVERSEWSKINFENLSQIDIVEALDSFELNRDMTKTGVFKPIEPLIP